MGKKVIKLTESEFKDLVTESVKGVLNVIGYRGAVLPHGTNYNAIRNKSQNKDTNAADQERSKAITQSILDFFPSLKLHYIERDKANQFYSVEFSFLEMRAFENDRFVMKGNLSISGEEPKQGYVEFNYQQQSFYRVNFYGKGTVRRIYPLMMDNDYEDVLQSFLSFVSNIGYSEKDNEYEVGTNGPTMSKSHQKDKP